ncbi:MAG: hypothetical protein AAF487_02885 [Bacteroidota bacterium]
MDQNSSILDQIDQNYFMFKFKSVQKLKLLIAGGLVFLLLILIKIHILFLPLVLILVIGVLTSSEGVEIKGAEYRSFYAFLGIKTGHWSSVQSFPFTTIKMTTGTQKRYTPMGAELVNVVNKKQRFDFHLCNESHRKTIFLKSFESLAKALSFAKEFELKSGFIYQTFNPKISSATMARKRKSRHRR